MKAEKPKKAIQATFYMTDKGNEPVRDFLDGLTAHDRKSVGADIAQVEWKWPGVKGPLIDSFGKGLYEVRTNIKDGIVRVYFSVDGGKMILIHGLVKKTKKADPDDVKMARKRLKDWKDNNP